MNKYHFSPSEIPEDRTERKKFFERAEALRKQEEERVRKEKESTDRFATGVLALIALGLIALLGLAVIKWAWGMVFGA